MKSFCHIYGQLGQTAARFSAELDHMLKLCLVCDTDFGLGQVTAWVQWRHLKVQIEGLQGSNGNHVLHLHVFDPEVRDISQRIYLFNPDSTAVAPLLVAQTGRRSGWELCVASHWELPKGLNSRWQPEALCSIPDECLPWKSIGVWISPLEKMKLHDLLAKKGAPGLLSHLWVTKI
jgi:hypothetical protein